MPNQKEAQVTEVVFSWKHPSEVRYQRNIWWHVIAILVIAFFSWWSIVGGFYFGGNNYLFIIFLVLFYIVILLSELRPVEMIDFAITPDGIKSGSKFFSYKDFDHFYLIYEESGVKNLYLEFKNALRGRLIVPVDGQDAVAIRDYLLNYLNEDLEREAEPLSERIRRWLKL